MKRIKFREVKQIILNFFSIKASDDAIRSSYIGIGIGGILLILEIFALICKVVSGYWVVLADFPIAMDDASVFLNLLCVGWILYAIFCRIESSLLYYLYVINLLLINHLYSNEKWKMAYDFLKQNWRDVVWAVVIIAVLLGIGFISFWSYFRHKNSRQSSPSGRNNGNGTGRSENFNSNMNSFSEGNDEPMEKTEKESDTGYKKNQKFQEKQGKNSNMKMEVRFIFNQNAVRNLLIKTVYFVGILCFVLFVVDFLVYDLLDFGFERPEIIVFYLNTIRQIEIILVVAAISVAFVKNISFFQKLGSSGATAIIAVVLDVIFVFSMNRITELDFTSQFLNALTGNAFGIFLIFVISFLVIHILISIAFHFFLKESDSVEGKEITKLLKKYIYKLEEKIVLFSCNILIGMLNLLCFIPDFFNTIGYTLLEERNMFQLDIEDDTEKEKEDDTDKETDKDDGKTKP